MHRTSIISRSRVFRRPRIAQRTLDLPLRHFTTTLQAHTSPSSVPQQQQQHHAPTVSASEVSHFNALASSWWDPHGPSRLLHLMNPLRHTFITQCLTAHPPSNPSAIDYLDVGCGGGIFAESAARQPSTARVTGIDPSSAVLDVARGHARRDPALGKLEYRNCAVEDVPAEETFDVVTLFEVLEHVATPSTFLEHVGRHVKPGGWLVVSTIARTWSSWVTTKLVAEGVLRIVPWGTHEWRQYVNEVELRDWFCKGKVRGGGLWERPRAMGVVYVPGFGWREISGSEEWGNYFFAVRKAEV